MARASKLKVFRTPIGFHDAYVAAPTQKGAIEAWGAGKDLFTRGLAEVVTDPALTAEPLGSPGKVIKRLRGSAAEQLAALGPDTPNREGKRLPNTDRPSSRPPKPSRATLDTAEQALANAKLRQAAELKALAEREAALKRERRALVRTQAEELASLKRQRDDAAKNYERAVQCRQVERPNVL